MWLKKLYCGRVFLIYLYLNRCEINCYDKVSVNNCLFVIGICVNCDQEGFILVFYWWEMYV